MCITHFTGLLHIFIPALLWQQQSFQQFFVDDIICTEFLSINSLSLFEFNVLVYTVNIMLYTYTVGASLCFIWSLIMGQMDPEHVSDIIMAVGLLKPSCTRLVLTSRLIKNVHDNSVTLQSCTLLPVTHRFQSFMFFVASVMFR